MFIFASLFKGCLAGVVELVDTLDLGSSAARCGSSSLPARTKQQKASHLERLFCLNLSSFKLFKNPLFYNTLNRWLILIEKNSPRLCFEDSSYQEILYLLLRQSILVVILVRYLRFGLFIIFLFSVVFLYGYILFYFS